MLAASGNVVHSLRLVDWSMAGGFDWADSFDGSVRSAILDGRARDALDWASFPGARLAVPTREHFVPLLTTLGAAGEQDRIAVFNDYRELGSMSMTSYRFG
jgi:4,5-DOPA dioxygenase extradiol